MKGKAIISPPQTESTWAGPTVGLYFLLRLFRRQHKIGTVQLVFF